MKVMDSANLKSLHSVRVENVKFYWGQNVDYKPGGQHLR